MIHSSATVLIASSNHITTNVVAPKHFLSKIYDISKAMSSGIKGAKKWMQSLKLYCARFNSNVNVK